MYFLRRPINFHNYFKISKVNILKQFSQSFHDRILEDNLEEFTSQLTQKKAHKWYVERVIQMSKKNYLTNNKIDDTRKSTYDIKTYSIEEVNLLFQECIQNGDNFELLNLTKQCIECQKCPALPNLIHVVTLCAQTGDKDTIISIRELCEKFHPEIVKANSYFKHYLAEAFWIRGNISISLEMLKEVYTANVLLRKQVRSVFKYLIQDVVSTRSEAALIKMIKFASEILENYNDFHPLSCVWQTCILSEWYSDQNLALDLLATNKELCKAILNKIPYVVVISLNKHRTEVVYRLLEFLLKYEMKIEYSGILSNLLDYQISQGDLGRATEIIRWSVNNDVQLPVYQNEKFINLLLNDDSVNNSQHCLKLLDKFKKKKTRNRDLKF